MTNLVISGSTNPISGKETFYSIFPVGLNTIIQNPLSPISTEKAHWEILVLEKRRWRKTNGNTKIGDTVSFNFKQSSVAREGLKIVVTRGNSKGELIIKRQRAGNPKVNSVSLFDKNYNKITKPLNYADTIIARAHCTDMEGETIYFTLWEDDAIGGGHDEINQINKINPIPLSNTVVEGKAEVRFNMALYTMASRIADMQVAKGDKSEGKNHEYYVTVDYYGKIAGESKNINIKNANDNPIQRAYELQYPERVPQKPQQPNKRPAPPPVKPKKDTFKAPVTAGAKTKAPDPKGKILSTHFVNLAQQPIQYLQMGVPFYAKIRSQGMKGKTVKLNLFEDDTFDDLVYEQNVTLTSDVCLYKIIITDKMREKGGDLYGQQYYIEIEYSAQSVKSSVLNLRDDAILTKLKTAVSKAGVKKQEILKDKESKCFCNKDFTEADVKKFVKLLKGSEIIWEGQALRGGRRAECNISDKSFSKLTNVLNSAFKKYKINTCAQKMHFLAQVTEETGTFSLSEETAGQYASSQSIYKGRGLLQLTGIKNNTGLYNDPGPYQNYADYKNDQNIVRNPNIVANDVNYCIDSGAWIWSVNKKMPNAPSEAVDRWGIETSGKSLNELAEFGDKYLELISVLLNGRNKDTDMPNGWAKRQANYKLLKTGFFIYEKFHGNQAMKSKNAQDIATFNIYHNGKIEKYIPKNIKSGYEGMYKYLYYDINNNEHEICMVDFISVNKRQNGSTINSIPRGYIKTYSYPQGGNARTAYVYANGDICVEGTGYGFKKYPKGIGKVELVRMKDSLSYEKDNVRIFYSFKNSQRRYCNPESYAAFLGALAALNRTDVLCTGMCFEDATSYPSVTHPNGDSADTAYFPTLALEQKKVNAFKSFNFKNIYRGSSGWYPNLIGTKYSRGHEDHLHAGDFDSNIVIIIKE